MRPRLCATAYPAPSSTTHSRGTVSRHALSVFPRGAPNTAASMSVISAPSPPDQSAVASAAATAAAPSPAAVVEARLEFFAVPSASSRESVHRRTAATGANPALRYSGAPIALASSTASVDAPMESSAALRTIDATPLLR